MPSVVAEALYNMCELEYLTLYSFGLNYRNCGEGLMVHHGVLVSEQNVTIFAQGKIFTGRKD